MTNRVRRAGSAALLVVLVTPLYAQGDTVAMQDIRECRQINDAEIRLACYDRLGEPMTSRPDTAAEQAAQEVPSVMDEPSVQATEQDTRYRELTEDVGLPKEFEENQVILATVARCGEANNRKFYFYFDNGQIWKYVGGKKLRYKDCNTRASLQEDRFGYTLQLDGDSRSMRVERVK